MNENESADRCVCIGGSRNGDRCRWVLPVVEILVSPPEPVRQACIDVPQQSGFETEVYERTRIFIRKKEYIVYKLKSVSNEDAIQMLLDEL